MCCRYTDNIKETLTKPRGVYFTVRRGGVSAKQLRKRALNLPPLLHPAQTLLYTGILQRVFRFKKKKKNGQRFCYSKKPEKLDLTPVPHVSDGRVKPRARKCTVNVPRSAGSKKEHSRLVSLPRCASRE